jgi:hypothetical protein
MSKGEAFDSACAGAGTAHLSNPRFRAGLAPPASNRFFRKTGPVDCEYKSRALEFDYWYFKSDTWFCWGPREENMYMNFVDDKLVQLEVSCGVIDT